MQTAHWNINAISIAAAGTTGGDGRIENPSGAAAQKAREQKSKGISVAVDYALA